MIWAMLAILIFGGLGGSSDQYLARFDAAEARLKEVVLDAQRRDAALAVIAEMRSARKAALQDLVSIGERFRTSFEVRKTPRIELEGCLEQLAEKRRVHWERQLNNRFALRAQLSEAEWRAVFPAPTQPAPSAEKK